MQPELDLFAILPEDKIPEKGKILISEPFLPDSFFNRSIIYRYLNILLRVRLGFILNKKLDMTVDSAIQGFDGWNENPEHGGGPVAPDTIHYLHSAGDMIPNSVHVEGNIFWGGDIDAIRELIQRKKILPTQIRFFLGYSGWSAGQLDRELKDNSWVIANVKSEIVMNSRGNDTWKSVS